MTEQFIRSKQQAGEGTSPAIDGRKELLWPCTVKTSVQAALIGLFASRCLI